MTRSALLCLAPGSEEIEAITTLDLLTRAGIKVDIASVAGDGELLITCSRGARLQADAPLVALADGEHQALILPGGSGGAQAFAASPVLLETVRHYQLSGRLVAAICAVPALVLCAHALYPNANMTGFPGLKEQIPACQWRDKRVYFDARYHLLTSQGPGTSMDFALKIIALLAGNAHAAAVARQLVLPPGIYDYQDSAGE